MQVSYLFNGLTKNKLIINLVNYFHQIQSDKYKLQLNIKVETVEILTKSIDECQLIYLLLRIINLLVGYLEPDYIFKLNVYFSDNNNNNNFY